ncbi:hypothetical protein L2E82_05577 [Cichorium intybus]|uniref:Uncharacterized protein n=1 Tax=Cichorium intybus TaxID=13427 RepID=A0ACB9H7K5_CICIN|nr:hypothetical protein L2E82_05577 [Cichorium intybus]
MKQLQKVDKSIEEFQSVLKNDGDDLDSRWSEILEEPHSKVAFIGDALFVLQHFAGINAVLYFSSLTFKDAGISNGALASLYVRLTNFACALCALYFVDRQWRKRLIIGSYLGMCLIGHGRSCPYLEVKFSKDKPDELIKAFLLLISKGKLSTFSTTIASSGRLLAKNMQASECVSGYIKLLNNVVTLPSDFMLPDSISQLPGEWEWDFVLWRNR